MKLREFNNMYVINVNVKENGLYDKDFNEIIKIGNYGIGTTGNDNYFLRETLLIIQRLLMD